MKHIAVFAFLFIILGGMISCRKEVVVPIEVGYGYFPDQVGSYVVYDVDSFYYNSFTKQTDTFKFQLKEKIESTFLDNQNRNALRLERSIRNYDPLVPYASIPWTLRDVWMENKTASTAEKVEENVRYIKLAFPVKSEQEWDGNAQNTLGTMLYNYKFIDQARTIGSATFDSVLQVDQAASENLIAKKYYIEMYAKHTGLIYKKVIDVSSQPDPTFTSSQLAAFYAKPIMLRVTSGVQYIYTYNSSGVE